MTYIYLVFLHWMCKFDDMMLKFYRKQFTKHVKKFQQIADKIC